MQGVQEAIRGPLRAQVEACRRHDLGKLLASGAAGAELHVREAVSPRRRDHQRDEGQHREDGRQARQARRGLQQVQDAQEPGQLHRQQAGAL